MCPLVPSLMSDIGVHWTDQELILFLDRVQHGSAFPSNVLVDVNPFEHSPSNLPDDIWYFVRSDTKKETEIGVWRASGEGCQIYEDSKLTGWRSTLEFYKDSSDDSLRTDWVMQKYWITPKGTQSVKASGCLCRVFPRGGEYRQQKRQRYLESLSARGQESLLPEEHASCDTQNIPTKVSEMNVKHDDTKPSDPGESPDELDCFASGDYLELLDLVNPRSSTSSSDNSSCVSMASDDCFDYLALLNDLEHDNGKEIQSNSTNCHLSVSTSSMPKVSVSIETHGRLVTLDEEQSPGRPVMLEPSSPCPVVETKPSKDKGLLPHAGQNHERAVINSLDVPSTDRSVTDKGKTPVDRIAQQDIPHESRDAMLNLHEASSSSSQIPVAGKGKKIARGKIKMLKKKYLCFIPF